MKTIHTAALESRFASGNLRGFEDVVAQVRRLFDEGSDLDLWDVRPDRFARKKNLDAIRTLKAFLHLTKAGVFDLNWTVHCPHCKGGAQESSSLAGLVRDSHCGLCHDDFEANFDQNVELSFRGSPGVVTIDAVDPAVASMSSFELLPGIAISIEPGEEHTIEYRFEPGNYLLGNWEQISGVNFAVLDVEPQDGQTFELNHDDSSSIGSAHVKPGLIRIVIRNRSSRPQEFHLARVVPPSWVDGAMVSSLQEFRDLFAEELLSPDQTFSIRNLALIFTDIKSSTEMYERLGDSKAFYLVQEHFKIMEDVVRSHAGGVVKTIGDAVMAVFYRPKDAMAAARDMITRFDAFNVERGTRDQIIIKVGVHTGSCIAVTLNERLDYFGTSVNTAARIQGLSDGRDVMVSERLFRESEAEGLLSGGWRWEHFITSLKGLQGTQTVYKLYKDSAPI
jgi:class 3 adenylate cyclase